VSKVGLLTRVPSSQHTNTVSPGTKLISERHHCREAPHQHVHACPRLSRALLSTHLPRFATVQKSVFLCGGRDARVQYSVSCENKQVCGNAAGSPSPCTTWNPFLDPPPPFRRLHFHQDALFRQKSGLPDPTPPTTGPLPPLGPSVHADHSLPRRSGHRRVTAGLNGSVVCDGGGGCWPPRCFNASTLQLSRSLNAERAVA
jgi:hypothetical protein